MRHVLSLFDLSKSELESVLDLSRSIKAKYRNGEREPLLPRKVIGMIFEKPSLRTRVSFETGIRHLGGSAIFLTEDVGWGKREPIEDFAQVLSRFVDAIVCRANSHTTVTELASYSVCPVINGLTDLYHPCQALADILTMYDRFGSKLSDRKITYVGDCNNVARSLVIACGKLEIPISIACPDDYQFDQTFHDELVEQIPDVQLEVTNDTSAAVKDASAVYTDVWASMGQEAEEAKRNRDFAAYQVNESIMANAASDAIFLHCLPAHRGLEVSPEVIDGDQSAVYEQAENRMHAQKGLMTWLLQGS